MKLKPLHDWAVIERSEAEERSPGGIIIPDTAKDRPSEGIVVSIGPGSYKKIKGKEKFFPTTLQPGQRVAYPKYMAKEADLGAKKFILVREADILGTFEGERKPARKEPEQQNRPVVTREVRGTTAVGPARKKSSGKKRATKEKAVQKSTRTAEEKKTKKKTLTKSITTKTGPRKAKKPRAKNKEKTLAPRKMTKKTAGSKKTAGKRTPSKGITAQKKKAGSSVPGKKRKSPPGVRKKKK
jgi:chaperonin GroES